jgi:hypothetical protein
MNFSFKTFTSVILSYLLLSCNLHIDHFHDDHSEGYSICDTSCNDENHHSSNHHCDKCMNDNHRVIAQGSAHAYSYTQILSVYILDEFINDDSLPYKLYSRPPPNLL